MTSLFFLFLFVGTFIALNWPVSPSPAAQIVQLEYHNLITEVRHQVIESFLEELGRRCEAKGVPAEQFPHAYREFLEFRLAERAE